MHKPLRIALLGPGFMPIPPKGWGAVETVISNLDYNLRAIGCDTCIINTQSEDEARLVLDVFKPNIVWIHYDVYARWFANKNLFIDYKIWITGHFAYLSQYQYSARKWKVIFRLTSFLPPPLWRTISQPFRVLGHRTYAMVSYLKVLESIATLTRVRCVKQVYLSLEISSAMDKAIGGDSSVLPNCAREDLIRFTEDSGNGRAICLGKIEPRKKQRLLSPIPEIDFVGPISDPLFPRHHKNYLGAWSRSEVEHNLTDYSVLVLLSDGEAHALVVIEALLAGLSVMVSEEASSHLSEELPFVSIIPKDLGGDLAYIREKLCSLLTSADENRCRSRGFALEKFSCNAQQSNLSSLIINN